MSEHHAPQRKWHEYVKTAVAACRREAGARRPILWGLLALLLAGGALSLIQGNIVVRPGASEVALREIPAPEEFVSASGSQRCTVEPFSVSADLGGIGAQEVVMRPPFPGASFQLLAGDLPHGIEIKFDPREGVFRSHAQLQYLVTRFARPGSYTVLIVYRARDAQGGMTSVSCQSNLIVRR